MAHVLTMPPSGEERELLHWEAIVARAKARLGGRKCLDLCRMEYLLAKGSIDRFKDEGWPDYLCERYGL